MTGHQEPGDPFILAGISDTDLVPISTTLGLLYTRFNRHQLAFREFPIYSEIIHQSIIGTTILAATCSLGQT